MRTNKEVFCGFDNCRYNHCLTCENEEYEKCIHRLLEQSFLKMLRINYGCKYCVHYNLCTVNDMEECENNSKFMINIEEVASDLEEM